MRSLEENVHFIGTLCTIVFYYIIAIIPYIGCFAFYLNGSYFVFAAFFTGANVLLLNATFSMQSLFKTKKRLFYIIINAVIIVICAGHCCTIYFVYNHSIFLVLIFVIIILILICYLLYRFNNKNKYVS